jgi:hypothetical protein
MWLALLNLIGGPVVSGLISAYREKLKAGNVDSKIASDLASTEIAAQTAETQAITSYRIAAIGKWYEPEHIMGYAVAVYLCKLLIWDKVFGLGITDPLLGWSGTVSTTIVGAYFGKRTFENVARIIKR